MGGVGMGRVRRGETGRGGHVREERDGAERDEVRQADGQGWDKELNSTCTNQQVGEHEWFM